MDDDVLWMTATASRRKKQSHQANDDRRRSDRPERSRHTRNTKERSHDRNRHTGPVEKPLNYAGKHHLPDDRADPDERVRAWVQRTQNRHPHRSPPMAPDSDERLRRTSSPRHRGADIIRGKKRGRSVSRSSSVSLDHGLDGGRADTRFEKRRRYKTHEDKYEYKGGMSRKKQPNKELRVEPERELASRSVVDRHKTTQVQLRSMNTENHMIVSDPRAGRANNHLHANYAPEAQDLPSSSKVFEDRYRSGHRFPVLLRPSRQYTSIHPREPQCDLSQDDSYFPSSSRTGTAAYEQERKRQHFSKEPKSHEQAFANNGRPGSKSMNYQGVPVNSIRPSMERHPAVSPPVQLATPSAKDPSRHEGTDPVPPRPQHIVTVVLPRYKDVETQTDSSLLAGLLNPIADVAKAPDQPVDIASQAYGGSEIQRRIQLLPDSPYSNTKPPPFNGLKHEPSHQYYEPPNGEAQAYATEQSLGRTQNLAEQIYREESVLNPIAPMQSQHYFQAPAIDYANGGSQLQYLGQYHTSHSQPFNTNTFADSLRTDCRLSDLVQQHGAPSPARIMIGSQQLSQRLGQRVRFQEPKSTFHRPEEPYMEDIDDFIRRIEEEDLGELSDALAAEENDIPVKAEGYDGLGVFEHERPNTVQNGECSQFGSIVMVNSPAGDYDTDSFMGSRSNGAVGDDNLELRTPEMISRPPVSTYPRYLGQERVDIPFTGKLARAGQALVRPGQYRGLYET